MSDILTTPVQGSGHGTGADMRRYLANALWIVAFLILCAVFAGQIISATQSQRNTAAARAGGQAVPWVCPILGQCGPAGTPGLGRW